MKCSHYPERKWSLNTPMPSNAEECKDDLEFQEWTYVHFIIPPKQEDFALKNNPECEEYENKTPKIKDFYRPLGNRTKSKGCSHCGEHRPIVYTDWASAGDMNGSESVSVKLCWSCLDVLGWEKEMRAILPLIRCCSDCKQKFIPKKSTQTRCGPCWFKILNKVEVNHVQPEQAFTSEEDTCTKLWQFAR